MNALFQCSAFHKNNYVKKQIWQHLKYFNYNKLEGNSHATLRKYKKKKTQHNEKTKQQH